MLIGTAKNLVDEWVVLLHRELSSQLNIAVNKA